MARVCIGSLLALALCMAGTASFAESSPAPSAPAPAPSGDAKTPAKKPVPKAAKPSVTSLKPANPVANLKPYTPATSFGAADEASKATRLEEGRKKFFEQSSGFDNSLNFGSGPPSGAPGSTSGGTPGLGLPF